MLVVKWFLNDDTTPIYQWIVELGTRSVVQRLMGRIDSNYSIPGASKYTRYRAIRLLNPTTDLSGKYTCNVQSIRGEQNRAKTMIVYGKCLWFHELLSLLPGDSGQQSDQSRSRSPL